MGNLKQDETEMISISKDSALEGFCLLRQEERSLDHVLFDDWQELVSFYQGDREERVLKYLDEINEFTFSSSPVRFNRRMFENRLKTMPRLFRLVSSLFHLSKHDCFLQQDEIGFIAHTLSSMIALLPGKRPSDADIIQLRMDALLCQNLILMRYPALPHLELEKASQVENFNMPEHLCHYTVEEIVGGVSSNQRH